MQNWNLLLKNDTVMNRMENYFVIQKFHYFNTCKTDTGIHVHVVFSQEIQKLI